LQRTQNLGLEVRPDCGDGRGKGVFAQKLFLDEDVMLEEPAVVAIQHSETRSTGLVCSRCFTMVGSIEEQLANNYKRQILAATGRDDKELSNTPLPKLPCSDHFPLPSIICCSNGPCCDAVYCSEVCRDASWQAHHCLLCPASFTNDKNNSLENNGGSSSSLDIALMKDVLFEEFYEHAESTNDIFILAAQAVATVLLEAERQLKKNSEITNTEETTGSKTWLALKKAWIPFSMGHKALWWEAVALPSDVPAEEEDQFRSDMKEMAEDSLYLFTEAVKNRNSTLVTTFPAVLHLNIWGSLIGMFELNNLSMLVASPVPLWAQEVDDVEDELTEKERENLNAYKSVEEYGGLKGIMKSEFEWVCLGNAFYSLQACLNHSCVPNARAFKRDQDKNGNAVILSVGKISPGEEITISYISEDSDATLEERTEELRDYGFQCSCEKCSAERLALELQGL
jgi:SET domain